MRHHTLLLAPLFLLAAAGATGQGSAGARGGCVVERDADIRREEPGPHQGLGRTTGYVFFQKVNGLPFSFRKRVLHPGSSIGSHPQTEDEVYYVVSGAGRMTVDGRTFEVGPGDAVLTRPGSSHGLVQQGHDDLVLVIVFPLGPPTPTGRVGKS